MIEAKGICFHYKTALLCCKMWLFRRRRGSFWPSTLR